MKAKPQKFVIWSNAQEGWRREADGGVIHVTLLASATRYERGRAVDIVSERPWLAHSVDVQPAVMLVAPECAVAE